MNANELADELDYCYGKEYPCPASKEAADMLRQQQAEIDNLTSIKYVNGVTISKLYAEIEALKAENKKYEKHIAIGYLEELKK